MRTGRTVTSTCLVGTGCAGLGVSVRVGDLDGCVAGIDIGGTFTDAVIVGAGGRVTMGKASTTPPDFQNGFIDALAAAAGASGADLGELLGQTAGLYHGCTVGTNALVEGRTASVGLLSTRGHRDSIFIMQAGGRNLGLPPEDVARVAMQRKPEPLVPKRLALEVEERIGPDGAVVVALNEEQAREAIQSLIDEGVEAFAVSLLWSVANPEHELALGRLIAEMAPEAFVSLSHEVIARVGEYPRTVATVINSLIGPAMDRYLVALERDLADRGYRKRLWVMSCSGGVVEAAYARRRPLLTVGSGPVAGLIGAGMLSRAGAVAVTDGRGGPANVITADMGGTTFDVGVIRAGQPIRRPTTRHGRYEYFVPTLDVRSIGAGGGSIVRYDGHSHSLRVGPTSAGARPGPVAYGRGGTEPTVTDAALVLGYINPDYFLGGQIRLDVDAAAEALERVGGQLGFDAVQAAAASVRIVESQMADAIRLASVQQGYDPRSSTLYAYGGGGALHASAIAAQLGIARIVVPLGNLASGWSAFGAASSDVVLVAERPEVMAYPFDDGEVNRVWSELEASVQRDLEAQGIGRDAVRWERWVEMRYTAQVNVIEVRAPDGEHDAGASDSLIADFEREYQRLFGQGTGYPAAGFVMTTMKVRAHASLGGHDLSAVGSDSSERRALAEKGRRDVVFYDDPTSAVSAALYDGAEFEAGMAVHGPCVIEYPDTTVVLWAGHSAGVDRLGSVVIEVPAGAVASRSRRGAAAVGG